jgi:hypothetical protein
MKSMLVFVAAAVVFATQSLHAELLDKDEESRRHNRAIQSSPSERL